MPPNFTMKGRRPLVPMALLTNASAISRLLQLAMVASCVLSSDVTPNVVVSDMKASDSLATEQQRGSTKISTDAKFPLPFSPEWAASFEADQGGCNSVGGFYQWRSAGFGSNMNYVLGTWLQTLARKGTDVGVVVDKQFLSHVECREQSAGKASSGWDCIWGSIPHLCVYSSAERWREDMLSKGADEYQVLDALDRVEEIKPAVRGASMTHRLEEIGTDQFSALSVLASHVRNHLQPWMRHDVDTVLSVSPDAFREGPYVSLHVRRGDKVTAGEAQASKTEVYLARAAEYLLNSPNGVSPQDIRGVWIATDDPHVPNEVRRLARVYFPNVGDWEVGHISERDLNFAAGGYEGGTKIAYSSREQTYLSTVFMFADFNRLSAAEVFVGTFSSNVGRLVALWREGEGHPRESSMSVDVAEWYPLRN